MSEPRNWENLYYGQLERKRQWKARAHLAYVATGCLAIAVAVLTFLLWNQPPRVEIAPAIPVEPSPVWVKQTSSSDEPTAQHLLAVWRVGGCSATVVSKGDEWAAAIGAAHCVWGHPEGTQFWAHNAAGDRCKFELIAVDVDHDLAMFRLPADKVIGVAPIPESLPPEGCVREAVGYPNGQGPIYKRLRGGKTVTIQTDNVPSQERWQFQVESGQFWGGDSGGGVFIDGLLCGVISNRNVPNEGTQRQPTSTTLYCAPHLRLVTFARRRSGKRDWNCGGLFCPAPQQPQYVPPRGLGENDGETAPAPPRENGPTFKPNPNYPIKQPLPDRPEPKAPAPGPAVPDLAAELVKIQQAIAALQKQLGTHEPADVAPLMAKLQALEASLQKLASRPDGPSFDPDALNKGLTESLRSEVSKLSTDHEETFRTVLHEQLQAQGLEALPDAVSNAAASAAKGAISQVKGDLVSSVVTNVTAATTPALGGLLGPALAGLAGGGPAGLVVWLGLRGMRKLLQRRSSSSSNGNSSSSTHQGSTHTHSQVTREVAVPVAVQAPPAPQQIVTETIYQPIEVNSFAEAYAWAKGRYALMNPNSAEAATGQLDSLISQYLSGKGQKTHGVQ